MDASVPDHNYGRRFSQADGSHKKKKKKAPKRMSSFSSEGGNSFQGILDDDTEIDHFELRASASRRSSTAENTPVGLSRYGVPMADVGLDASVQVDGHMGRRAQDDYYQDYYHDYPQKDSSKNKSRWMMLAFVLVQGVLLVALLATLEHATQQKKNAAIEQPVNATAALRGNPEPPAVDLEGGEEEEDSNEYLVAEEDEEDEEFEEEEEELDDEELEESDDEEAEEEEEEDEDDDIDLQSIFAEAEEEDSQAEQIALDEAANAPTTAQREAYLMEADALERLETTEELEARAWADLEENSDLDSDEESDLETKAETLGQLEDNLSQQADLLDLAGQTTKKEERHAIAKKVKALQKEEKELQQKTEEESNDLEDGS